MLQNTNRKNVIIIKKLQNLTQNNTQNFFFFNFLHKFKCFKFQINFFCCISAFVNQTFDNFEPNTDKNTASNTFYITYN